MAQSGGCLCGQVHYQIEGDPMVVALCHCTRCQRQSGGAFSVNLMIQEAQLHVDGDLATFEDMADSGNKVYRRFCQGCGSPILSGLQSMPGLIAIKAGTLDDTSGLNPTVQVWCDSKQDWLKLAGEMTSFAKSSS